MLEGNYNVITTPHLHSTLPDEWHTGTVIQQLFLSLSFQIKLKLPDIVGTLVTFKQRVVG